MSNNIIECNLGTWFGRKVRIDEVQVDSSGCGICSHTKCQRYQIGYGEITVASSFGSSGTFYVLNCRLRPHVSFKDMVDNNRELDRRGQS